MSLNDEVKTSESDRSKLIFLHHIDDFETNAIKKHLMEENIETHSMKYEIYGCMNQQENLVKVMHDKHPLEILNSTNDNYFQKMLNCDILVFNANSNNFEKVCFEMRLVMKGIEELYKEKNETKDPGLRKFLVLISSPMTWALTMSDIMTKDEEDNGTGFLLEEDYRRRKAHKNYCKHKLLERDVIWLQKKCKHFVKTLVVCPGVLYGAENDKFHHIFKCSFYNQTVPIVGTGRQLIPMIYIKDFVRIMKNIFDNFPESKIRYIFAVQPTLMSLKKFTYNICKAFNEDCSKVRFLQETEICMMDKELFPQSVLDLLSLNLKIGLTFLKDFDFHELTDDLWCKLAEEFRTARNLHPLKIVVDGPPLVGKTEHSQKLSEYYQIPYINTCEVINIYIKYLEEKISNSTVVLETFDCFSLESGEKEDGKVDGSNIANDSVKMDQEDQNLMEDLKTKIKEWSRELFELKAYIASHKDFEDQDFTYLSRCLIALISKKQYNDNQGYIIDNFPFTYDQANQIFYNTRRLENVQLETSHLDNNIDSIPPLRPSHAIIFDAPDELLCKRAMNLTETEATIRRCLRHQMLPRLDAYRERNEGSECLANIFYDNNLIPISIHLDEDAEPEDTFQIIKNEIGSPLTYPLSSAQQKALNDKIFENRLKEKEEQSRKKEELLESLTIERERKLSEWSKKYEEIQKQKNELHEVKTLPLRQYLAKYVLPTLTEGILKIAEVQPDDPVDFLAEYLFNCNPEGQRMPPFCTNEQRTQFENIFLEDLTSNGSNLFDMNKLGSDECNGK